MVARLQDSAVRHPLSAPASRPSGVTLRPYQEAAIDCLREHYKNRPLLVLATGSGKTVLAAALVRRANAKGLRILWLVHRKELVTQAAEHIKAQGLNVGIIMAGEPEDRDADVQVASILSLVRREPPPADLIVYDEAHHVRSSTALKVLGQYPQTIIIGLTATPCRLDGKGLGEVFGAIVEPPSAQAGDLIRAGYLSPYRYYAPPGPSVKGVRRQGGDFAKGELELRMNRAEIVGDILETYQLRMPGRTAIVFAVGVAHSEAIVAAFNRAGVPAEHLDAKTPPAVRDAALNRLKRGETKIVSNVGLFDEGFDSPALGGVIIARPTMSLGRHRQMIGRALRPAPGKEYAVILDHAGNYSRHGLPDEEVEWSLSGSKRAKRKDRAPTRACWRCGCVTSMNSTSCPQCGHVFPRHETAHVGGQLEEVKAPRKKVSMSDKRARYAQLLREASNRGHRAGVAYFRYRDELGVGPHRMGDLKRAAKRACRHVASETCDKEDHENYGLPVCRFCESPMPAKTVTGA